MGGGRSGSGGGPGCDGLREEATAAAARRRRLHGWLRLVGLHGFIGNGVWSLIIAIGVVPSGGPPVMGESRLADITPVTSVRRFPPPLSHGGKQRREKRVPEETD